MNGNIKHRFHWIGAASRDCKLNEVTITPIIIIDCTVVVNWLYDCRSSFSRISQPLFAPRRLTGNANINWIALFSDWKIEIPIIKNYYRSGVCLLAGCWSECPAYVLMFCMFLTTIIILLMQRMCKKLITIPDVTWAGGWMSFSHTRNRCEAVTGRVWIVGRFKILIEIHCPLQFYSQTLCCSWAFAQIWFRWICGLEAYGSTQMLKKKDMNHRLAVYYNKFTSEGEFHRKYLLTFLSSYLPT